MHNLNTILKQVQLLELKSKRLATHVFSGEYHSAFKGRGMSFKEVREYYPGDDVRFIDWNTSARFGHPFSKVFEEERSLTLMLLLDISGSMQPGSRKHTRESLMAEMAAVLAFSAMANNDKVGAILFSDKVEAFIAPSKGREHVLHLIHRILTVKPNAEAKITDFNPPLHMLMRTMKHTTISFLISDFQTEGFQRAMKTAAIKHDCIAVHLVDEKEWKLPRRTLLPLRDAETGRLQWMDTWSSGFAKAWKRFFDKETADLQREVNQQGWDYLRFATHADYVPALRQFFANRAKMPRRK